MITFSYNRLKGDFIMIPESIHVPTLIAAILVLASLVIIPLLAVTDGKGPLSSSTAMSDTPESVSCALPPVIDIVDDGGSIKPGFRPGFDRADKKAGSRLRTATFALG
jgi:hypothetical protein